MPFWLWLAVIVMVLAALWALKRRRPARPAAPILVRRPAAEPADVAANVPAAIPPSVTTPATTMPPVKTPITTTSPTAAAPQFLDRRAPGAPVRAPVQPRAHLTSELRPLRAGLNLLSATVECELTVTNGGDAPAEAIRAVLALFTAHAGQDADLARFNAAPIGRPAIPPFTLAPGETRTIRTIVAIARDAIQTITAANRPMFVPVVAANIVYATAGDDAQTARAWSIGIERVDSAKLAPFWLDAPARMHTTVAARPHAATLER